MPWVRIDDRYYSHPKVVAAGLAASGLDVRAMSWAAGSLTDGFIPESVLPLLAAGDAAAKKLAAVLVQVGRWEEVEGGWMIHDFLDFNPSAKKVNEERNAAAERMKESRKRKRSPDVRPNAERTHTERTPDRSSERSPEVRLPRTRPVPIDSESSSSLEVVDAPGGEEEATIRLVAEACDVLARRAAADPNRQKPVVHLAAWLPSARAEKFATHGLRAAALLADDPSLTAEALADLLEPPRTEAAPKPVLSEYRPLDEPEDDPEAVRAAVEQARQALKARPA